MFVGVCGRGRARRQVELVENVADVPFDRSVADEQGRGNLAIRLASRNQPQHLHLARAQTGGRSGLERSAEPFYTCVIGAGAKLLKDPTGRVELHLGSIDVAKLATGAADEDAHARSLVRGIDLLPAGPGLAQNRERLPGIAFGETDLPTRLSGHRSQHGRIEVASQ